jgi:hypothetical protein
MAEHKPKVARRAGRSRAAQPGGATVSLHLRDEWDNIVFGNAPRFGTVRYKKADDFAFCNPAWQAGIDLPPQEGVARLKTRYEDTENPLFMWAAVEIASLAGIQDADINYFLAWNAGNIVEAARETLCSSARPDFARVLELTGKKGETGRLRDFAIELRNAWICFEMRRAVASGETIKKARHRMAEYLKEVRMPLTEGTIERIARGAK